MDVVFNRKVSDQLAKPVARGVDHRPVVGWTLLLENREPQLQRFELGDCETHRPKKLIRPRGDCSSADVDLHSFDESARQTVALADRSQVGEKSVALDAEFERYGGDVVLLAVGDFRNDPTRRFSRR